jgi:GGDEF domain-containing protein
VTPLTAHADEPARSSPHRGETGQELLNRSVAGVDPLSMATAPEHLTPTTLPATTDALDDVTSLLPPREALLEQLAERLPAAETQPATLLILGLLLRDDGTPVAPTALAQVTSLLARSLRGDDWLGSCGSTEFAAVLCAAETAAKTAAERLVRAVAALEVPGLSATAGLAALLPELAAGEVLRRATLSLTSARRVGAGTVIRYRAPLA